MEYFMLQLLQISRCAAFASAASLTALLSKGKGIARYLYNRTAIRLLCLSGGLFVALAAQAVGQPPASSGAQYKIVDIYIVGLEDLSERHIQRYLNEYGIRLDALRSKKQLERAARELANFADSEITLLGLEVIYDYAEADAEVYVEVLVSEMSISFIPGGGNAYARFGWANRVPRKGLPSIMWLSLGYNRQDFSVDLPYLGYSPFGLKLEAGHRIMDYKQNDQWDFSESSRIRLNPFVMTQIYLQPISWLRLGLGLDLGLLYFLSSRPRLGLELERNERDIAGKWHGRLALLNSLSVNRRYLAKGGLGYHFLLSSRHELAGLFAANHSVKADLGLVTEPVSWFRPSVGLYGDWRTEGKLPVKSHVFSSEQEGYIRAAAELRLLFTPINIREPIAIDIGWNLGSIVGFSNKSANFADLNLQRDLELSLFTGPEVYFGMPVNVRGQFDFGIILRKQFKEVAFAFNIRVM